MSAAPIQIWPYDLAPPTLRALCDYPDETIWIGVFDGDLPPQLYFEEPAGEGITAVESYPLPDGRRVVISIAFATGHDA